MTWYQGIAALAPEAQVAWVENETERLRQDKIALMRRVEAMQAERDYDDRPHLLPRKLLWERVRLAEEKLAAARNALIFIADMHPIDSGLRGGDMARAAIELIDTEPRDA